MGRDSRGRSSERESKRAARRDHARLEEAVANGRVRQHDMKREIQRRKSLERDLLEANRRLTVVNEELDSFAFAVSHDLRAPLRKCSSLLTFLEEDQSPPLNEAAQGHLDGAMQMMARMREMIHGVLEYARARDAVKGSEVALESVAAEVLANLEVALSEAGGQVEVGKLPVVIGHRVRLVQLFQNIIQNAVRYRAERPLVIQISAEQQELDERWRITIQDNGIGMEPSQKDDSFVLFRRLNRTASGVGIGLALCKQIVEAHGGRIEVASELGLGSAFSFTLEAAS